MTQEELSWFRDNLVYLYSVLTVFQELRKQYEGVLGERLAKVLVSSLARNYLIGLASLIDPKEDNQGNRNMSIHLVGEIDLSEFGEVIRKLKKFRSKMLAHNDREAMSQGESFLTDDELTVEESERLLDHLSAFVEKASENLMPKEQIVSTLKNAIQSAFGSDR